MGPRFLGDGPDSLGSFRQNARRPRLRFFSRCQTAALVPAMHFSVQRRPVATRPFICPRNTPEHLSFRFGVRRHRRGYEWPPSVSYRANVGQDLLSLVFGHLALRVGQLVEALLNFRPTFSPADFAVLL